MKMTRTCWPAIILLQVEYPTQAYAGKSHMQRLAALMMYLRCALWYSGNKPREWGEYQLGTNIFDAVNHLWLHSRIILPIVCCAMAIRYRNHVELSTVVLSIVRIVLFYREERQEDFVL